MGTRRTEGGSSEGKKEEADVGMNAPRRTSSSCSSKCSSSSHGITRNDEHPRETHTPTRDSLSPFRGRLPVVNVYTAERIVPI